LFHIRVLKNTSDRSIYEISTPQLCKGKELVMKKISAPTPQIDKQLREIVTQAHPECAQHAVNALKQARERAMWLVELKKIVCLNTSDRLLGIMRTALPMKKSVGPQELQDIANAMGIDECKALLVGISILCASHEYPNTKILGAKCCAMAVISRIMARQMQLPPEDVWKAEVSGLFLPIGRLVGALYQHKADTKLRSRFISLHHHRLGAIIAEQHGLPQYLLLDDDRNLQFSFKSLSIPSLSRMVAAAVNRNFAAGNILTIDAYMPYAHQMCLSAAGTEIQNYFEALGFEQFLSITPITHPPDALEG